MRTAEEQLERKKQELANHPDRKKERELVDLENQLKKDLANANKEAAPFFAARVDCDRIAAAKPFKYFTHEEPHEGQDWEGFRDLVESTVPTAKLAKSKGYTKAESAFLAMWLNDVRRAYLMRRGKGDVNEINQKLMATQRELRNLQRAMIGLPAVTSFIDEKNADPILDAVE